ncbi:MAG: cache domain-containing protein [Desulfuromonadales bacterium]
MNFKSIRNTFYQYNSQLLGISKLRTVLIFPFVALIIACVSLVGYLSYQSGQSSVYYLADKLAESMEERIDNTLNNYIATPQALNLQHENQFVENNLFPDETANIASQNVLKIEHYFWRQLKEYPEISFSYIGTSSGEFYGSRKTDSDQLQIVRTNASTQGRADYYDVGSDGQTIKLAEQKPNYDARTRPWYQTAVKAKKAAWSPIYVDFSGRGLSITAVRPFYQKENLKGVFGSSFVFRDVNRFLKELKVSKTGMAFIIERSGDLVASSTDEPLIGANATRLNFRQSKTSLIKLSSEELLKQTPDLSTLKGKQKHTFTVAGNRYLLYVSPYADKFGLDWLTAIIIPEADFMSQIDTNRNSTILLCIVTLIVSIVLGMLAANWVTTPITNLNMAAKLLAEGSWDEYQTIDINRKDEMGQLGRSFIGMAQHLKEIFATLEQRVKVRTFDLDEANLALNRALTEQKLLTETVTLQKEEIEATVSRMKHLEGIISICMHCKKIRNEHESWDQLEMYISQHTDAMFSHGVCPECVKEHYPGIIRDKTTS